ncbi:hypothetical protein ALO36_104295 [Pseudomonas syringae pv. tomato]|nr:Unknown protein sequence [Pseudomonas syringae pv. syringae]KPB93214.1 Unknown protein sequence [Pseudomonas syringae pv. maculicola]KPY91683.1 hypothetical protein ALO36_104295 [Pseudomonas syringae pv. tomato]
MTFAIMPNDLNSPTRHDLRGIVNRNVVIKANTLCRDAINLVSE